MTLLHFSTFPGKISRGLSGYCCVGINLISEKHTISTLNNQACVCMFRMSFFVYLCECIYNTISLYPFVSSRNVNSLVGLSCESLS